MNTSGGDVTSAFFIVRTAYIFVYITYAVNIIAYVMHAIYVYIRTHGVRTVDDVMVNAVCVIVCVYVYVLVIGSQRAICFMVTINATQ